MTTTPHQGLESWFLSESPEKIAERAIALLKEERARIDLRIAEWETFGRSSGTKTAVPPPQPGDTYRGRPTLRSSILTVLDGDGAVHVDEIVTALDQRGWMPTGPKARQKVTDRLSDMTKRGELERVSYGVYKLVDGGAAPGGAQPSNDDLGGPGTAVN